MSKYRIKKVIDKTDTMKVYAQVKINWLVGWRNIMANGDWTVFDDIGSVDDEESAIRIIKKHYLSKSKKRRVVIVDVTKLDLI